MVTAQDDAYASRNKTIVEQRRLFTITRRSGWTSVCTKTSS